MNQSATPEALSSTQRVLRIVWPAFLAAGVLEMLVFAFVDPADLHWGTRLLDASPSGVYTLAFFAFWAVTGLSSWLTVALCVPSAALNASALTAADLQQSRKL